MIDREMDAIRRVSLDVHSALFCNEGEKGIIDTEVDSISLSCTRSQHEDAVRIDECCGVVLNTDHMTTCGFPSRLIDIEKSNRVAKEREKIR